MAKPLDGEGPATHIDLVSPGPITVFDVFDNFLGEETTPGAVRGLTAREIRGLAERLNEYHHAWKMPASMPGEFRVCPSSIGTHFLSPGLSDCEPRQAHRRIAAWMLYVDSALTLDPFSVVQPWQLDRKVGRQDIYYRHDVGSGEIVARPPTFEGRVTTTRQARRFIAQALDESLRYRKLAEDGALILVPGLAGWSTFMDRAVREFQDDQNAPPVDTLYYDASLQYAASQGSRFLPDEKDAWQYYQHRLSTASAQLSQANVDLQMLPALIGADMPLFDHAPPDAIAEARRNDESFDAWRVALRNAVRTIGSLPTDRQFPADAQSVLEDLIQPAAREIRRGFTWKTTLRKSAPAAAAHLALSAVYGAGAAAITGGSLGAVAASSGAGFLTSATLTALFPDRPTDLAALVATVFVDPPQR